jgi:hypothetical protein
MSSVTQISGAYTRLSSLLEQCTKPQPTLRGWTTDDCRRLLTDLKLRPPTQRDFLRKLLQRAAATRASINFPVTSLVVRDPVVPF